MRRNPLSPGEQALLARFLRRLLAAAEPGSVVRVRVFGSRARGRSHEGSDLDVAVLAAPGADRIRSACATRRRTRTRPRTRWRNRAPSGCDSRR